MATALLRTPRRAVGAILQTVSFGAELELAVFTSPIYVKPVATKPPIAHPSMNFPAKNMAFVVAITSRVMPTAENRKEKAKESLLPTRSAIQPAAKDPKTALLKVSTANWPHDGKTDKATGPPLKAPCQLEDKTYSSPYF